MSQAGIVNFEFGPLPPDVPTLFVANVGTAIPIANTIEILGSTVAAHSIPLETVASGNTVTAEVQYASAAVSSIANNAGVASFNSADFTVDANGFVSATGALATTYDCNTGSATPSAGILNVLGTGGINTVASGNTITISGEGISKWNLVSVNTNMASNNGYIVVSPGGNVKLTLPTTSAVGDEIHIVLKSATNWTIAQNAGQQIQIANSTTTSGVGGSLESTGTGDSVVMVCSAANTFWNVYTFIGNITVD